MGAEQGWKVHVSQRQSFCLEDWQQIVNATNLSFSHSKDEQFGYVCFTTGHRVSVQVAEDWMGSLLISGFCCSSYLRKR